MFAESQPTPYDLKFRILGFPVRVHPLFWLGTLLLGPKDFDGPLGLLPMGIWIVAVFVSILLHEVGHALAYRRYGCPARISLVIFGGLAASDYRPRGHWRNIFVFLAGPAVNLLIFAVFWVSQALTDWASTSLVALLTYFIFVQINLFWAILNLLPVWPLDGGQVCREVCQMMKLRRPIERSLMISIGVSLLFIVYVVANLTPVGREFLKDLPSWLPRGSLISVLFFCMLAFSNYEELRQRRAYSTPWHDDSDDQPWRGRR